MSVRVRRVVVGPLATNCWIVTPDGSGAALVVDPGDEPDRILAACAGLDVVAIVLTHAHFDHVLGLPGVARELGAPVLAHPADVGVWPGELAHLRAHGHFDAGTADLRPVPRSDRPLWDGDARPVPEGHRIDLDGVAVRLLHTPGHTPGGLTVEVAGHLLTGDTLFPGGPGLTGERWPDSDFADVMTSVDRLLRRPDATVVHPGHGPDTTVGLQRPYRDDWVARGW